MMPNLPYQQEQDDRINIHCVVCGKQIHAGSYPPVCRQDYRNCMQEWKIETNFNKWVNKYG